MVNYFKIDNALEFTLNSITLNNFESSATTVETFLYSISSTVKISVISSYIQCRPSYTNVRTTATFYSVFYLQNALELYSSDNTVKYCNYGQYGIYNLNYVTKITDTGSYYENNTA